MPAAICAGSFSSLLGMVLTPLLAVVLLGSSGGGFSADSALKIALQLLVPFLAGQLLRRWIGGFLARHRRIIGFVDRGSILLVVYTAFSQGVVAGIGFLGAGTILKDDDRHEVRGLTTAAGVWLTAAIGVAAGMGRVGSAVLSTALALIILSVLPKFAR